MIIIKTLDDIRKLKNTHSFDEKYTQYIENYFLDLMEAFRENESDEEFSLSKYGYIVLLESTDEAALDVIGIHNLLDAPLEYVNKIKLSTNCEKPFVIYNGLCLFDNEYGISLISIAGTLKPEIEEYLAEYAIE